MSTTTFNSETGRDQFLQLLVTQLRNQDPLEPVGQQDFLQQLAQFSVVEGVEKLNARFDDLVQAQQLSEGRSLIGREVRYATEDGTTFKEGRIAEVGVEDDRIVLTVGADKITIDQIQSVLADAA